MQPVEKPSRSHSPHCSLLGVHDAGEGMLETRPQLSQKTQELLPPCQPVWTLLPMTGSCFFLLTVTSKMHIDFLEAGCMWGPSQKGAWKKWLLGFLVCNTRRQARYVLKWVLHKLNQSFSLTSHFNCDLYVEEFQIFMSLSLRFAFLASC